jgi:hypothetical protein
MIRYIGIRKGAFAKICTKLKDLKNDELLFNSISGVYYDYKMGYLFIEERQSCLKEFIKYLGPKLVFVYKTNTVTEEELNENLTRIYRENVVKELAEGVKVLIPWGPSKQKEGIVKQIHQKEVSVQILHTSWPIIVKIDINKIIVLDYDTEVKS